MSSGTVIVSDAQRGPVHLSPLQIQPVVHSRIIVPARWNRISNESCTIKWALLLMCPYWKSSMANPQATAKS